MNEKFDRICRMSQKGVKKYCRKQLQAQYETVISQDGFLFAQGDFPVLLVAHMDTVHDALPTIIKYDNQSTKISSPNGIGGDDRCGVYMILKIIEKYHCSVLFCEDEEIGCVGAEKFVETELAKTLSFNYIMEFDRANHNDAVFYNCDNPDFEDFITKEFYEINYGSFSDIAVIAPSLGCAAVNLSCGYYCAHTKKEYVIIPEMEKSIEEACKILERTTEDDVFDYIESTDYGYGDFYNGNYDGHSYLYASDSLNNINEVYYIIEYTDENGETQWYDTNAVSKAEAIGKMMIDLSTMCYDDITDIYYDTKYCGLYT